VAEKPTEPTSNRQKGVEGDPESLPMEFPRPPDGYIRWTDLLKALGAIVGILGSAVGGWGLIDRRVESLRAEIYNARIECKNDLTELRSTCCRRR